VRSNQFGNSEDPKLVNLHKFGIELTSDVKVRFAQRHYLLCAEMPVIACCIAVRAAARLCGSASSGRPVPYGGCGAYSIISSMTRPMLSPAQCPATAIPKSTPAVTSPPVSQLRSTQTRSLLGSAPNWLRASRAPSAPQHGSLATVQRPLAAASLCRHCTPSGRGIRDQLERRLWRNRSASAFANTYAEIHQAFEKFPRWSVLDYGS
jgi:hypothetical protein